MQADQEERDWRNALLAANASYQTAIAGESSGRTLGNVHHSQFIELDDTSHSASTDGPRPRPREAIFDDALDMLSANGLTWGDLVMYVSDPTSRRGREKYRGMFDIPGRIEQLLTLWTSSRNSTTARRSIHAWIMDYMKSMISREGKRATKDGVLQSRKREVDEGFILNFKLDQIYDRLALLCPTMTGLLAAFTTTRRQANAQSATMA